MDQLERARRIIAEISQEVPLIVQQLNYATTVNEVKTHTDKLIAYIFLLSMILEDMISPDMHRMYWPGH